MEDEMNVILGSPSPQANATVSAEIKLLSCRLQATKSYHKLMSSILKINLVM
jgi:hypothetical protein